MVFVIRFVFGVSNCWGGSFSGCLVFSTMAGVKVKYGGEKLVVPIGTPTDRVKRLLDDIGIRLRRVLGKTSDVCPASPL